MRVTYSETGHLSAFSHPLHRVTLASTHHRWLHTQAAHRTLTSSHIRQPANALFIIGSSSSSSSSRGLSFLSLTLSRRGHDFPARSAICVTRPPPLALRLSTLPKLQITRSALLSLPRDLINIASTSNRTNTDADSLALATRSASLRQRTPRVLQRLSRLGSQKGRCARATP